MKSSKTKEIRQGRQEPTASLILPYKKSLGNEAIDLYNKTGRIAQPWQQLLLSDIMAVGDDQLWVHSKFGYSVPRRNGKNEIVAIREMWGLLSGERILHTAHRTSTTHSAWERLYDLTTKAGIEITSIYRAYGKEHITIKDGGSIEFRTRTSKGGLGEGFDLLIIDEAQEYQDDQQSALKYVVSDARNPQSIFCGTPPTPTSAGAVFAAMRSDVFTGARRNTGWAEWSVDKQSDPQDRELWYQTNPSLGTILTERNIEDEIGPDQVDFNIQRLGLWIKYNQKSCISEGEWLSVKVDEMPKIRGKIFVGIKYGKDGTNVAVSIAVKTFSDKIFIETYDCRPTRAGTDWIVAFLRKAYVQAIVIDGASGQELLTNSLKDARVLPKPILPTVKEVIVANAAFEQGLNGKIICHRGQPSLTQAATNCDHRPIGSNGGFGYKSLKEGADIALLESVALAYWAASVSKEHKKQQITY